MKQKDTGRRADAKTIIIRIVALVCALLIAGSAFAMAFFS